MNDKVDITIVKYYQSCFTAYEQASPDDKYEEALKAVVSLNKNGIKVCYHASICKIMEQFVVDFPTTEIIGSLFRSLNTYLEGVIVGKNTSRLLEKVLLACQSKEIAEDDIVQFQSQKFCDYMWTHYPDYLENNIGSHIVRLFFQFVCGVYVKKEDKVYSSKNAIISTPMQDNYEEKLLDLVKRFLLNAHIQQLITSEYMSATLQILLVLCSVRCKEKFKEVVKHLLAVLCEIDGKISKENSDDIHIPDSFQDKYQSFFIECLIINLPKGKYWKKFSQKYCEIGRPKFVKAILNNCDSCGIFKAAIARMTETDLLVEIVQQLKISLTEIADFECGNIFLKLLIEFVNKVPTITDQHHLRLYKQAIIEIVQLLASDENKRLSLTQLLGQGLKEQSKDEDCVQEDKEKEADEICSLWASLLVQAILTHFVPIPNSINKIFTSIDADQIISLSANSKASRVIEAFIKSTNVANEAKVRFLDGLTSGNLCEMACNNFGSRVMDSIWASSNNQLIGMIKAKLESERANLKSHKIGRFIESKFFGYIPKQQKDKQNTNEETKNKQAHTDKRKFEASHKTQTTTKKSKI